MKILVSGSTGFIGSSLTELLTGKGHDVYSLVRFRSLENEKSLYMNIRGESSDRKRFEGFDAVIHLAGENIAGRWTKSKKKRIYDSRIDSTNNIKNIIRDLDAKPSVFICASAVGYYGDRGDEVLTEDSGPGTGFLSDTGDRWEQAANEVSGYGIRVVNLRTGMVLGEGGGALGKMLLPFKLGLGGRLGNGNQYWSWISLDDEVAAIYHLLTNDSLNGPFNLVSPEPVTNKEFTETLSGILNRPAFMHIPETMVKIIFGDMGRELFLSSTRAVPKKLSECGFRFKHPDLRSALDEIVG